MMLAHLGHQEAGQAVVKAIEAVIRDSDVKTPDMGGNAYTRELGLAVEDAL